MKILILKKNFHKIVSIVRSIIIGITVIVICLVIYEELVGPAIAYVLEKPSNYVRELESENNPSLSELPIGSSSKLVTGDPIDIFEISKSELIKLIDNKKGEVLYIKDGVQRTVIYNGQKVYYLQFSPAQDKLGFYYYPDGNTFKDVVLVMIDIPERTAKEVYQKNIRTSGWEWDDDKYVIVYYNCGTGCLYVYKINAETGQQEDEYHKYLISSP